MSLHFLVAILGSLAAAAFTGMLVARCLRGPSAVLAAWTVALVGLTVALGAQALGYGIGFGPISFRAMELGAQLLAPLALALGLAELAGRTVTARFAARLLLAAVAIVAFVILATDPLSAATFSKAWPAATVFYQIFPNKLLQYVLAPATVIVALIALGVAAARPRHDPAWRDAFPAVAAASAAALMLSVPGIAALLKVSLPLGSLFTALCILSAAATWFSGTQAGRLRVEGLRQGPGDAPRTGRESRRPWAGGPDATGDFDPVAADDEFGIYRSNGAHRERGDLGYRDEAPYPDESPYRDEAGYRDQGPYRDEAGYREEAGYPSAAGYPDDAGSYDSLYRDEPGYRRERPGDYQAEGGYPVADYPPEGGYRDDAGYRPDAGYPPRAGPAGEREPRPHLFGQIAIYTLLEDRVDDFDRLTKQVVKQVRAQEPDTLVYIVHAVPSAPMQRILYEVYRDRAAYEAHKQQPYVLAFEADRRPYVLATNIIELGLQQAKVSPLPSVTDLLTDTGFDLLADTGFGQPGYGPRVPAGPPGGTAGGSTGPGGPAGGPAPERGSRRRP